MTSATGQRKPARPAPGRPEGVLAIARRPTDRGRRVAAPGGFTLLEVMLALALLVLLMGLAIGSFQGVLADTRTRENAHRMASLLRSARAEAANTGRRLRLSFDEATGQPALGLETDPLGEPGTFQPFTAWWVQHALLMEGVRIVRCELIGESAYADLPARTPGRVEQREAALGPITFYPDGASDSALLVLANDDDEHPWAVEITLNGVDGTITTRERNLKEEPLE